MRYLYWGIGIGVIAVLTLALLLAWGMSRSLLFYIHLLPADTYHIVAGVKTNVSIPPEVPLEAVKRHILSSQAQESLLNDSAFLYARSESREIIVRPTSIRNQLIQIDFVKGDRTIFAKDMIGAALATMKDILLRRYEQGSPDAFLLAAPHTFYENSEPLSVTVTGRTDGLRFSYTNSVALPPRQVKLEASSADKGGDNESLFISLPSGLLEKVTPGIIGEIETKLRAEIGLTSSKIDITTSLAGAEAFAIASGNETGTTAIALKGDKATTAIESWLAAEYGKNHPVTQPFLLPDGTRGFEVVPVADTTTLFSRTSHEHCRSAGVNDHSLFVCSEGDWASLSRSEEGAVKVLEKVRLLGPMSVVIFVPSNTYGEEGRGIKVVGTTDAGTGVITTEVKKN